MNNALVVGGTSGLGLSIALDLLARGYDDVYVVGRNPPDLGEGVHSPSLKQLKHIPMDLTQTDAQALSRLPDVRTLVYCAGFGRVAGFEQLVSSEIQDLVKVNQVAFFLVVKRYYEQMQSNQRFDCCVISSIAGGLNSPLFAVYAASKAAVNSFVESLNIELQKSDTPNRILNVMPGKIRGTKFHGANTDLESLSGITEEIVTRMMRRETKWIPDFEKTYKAVLKRYHDEPERFGMESYDYKMEKSHE